MGQGVQVEPGIAYERAGHGVQAEAPAALEEPEAHAKQELWPDKLWKKPAGHEMHAEPRAA